MAESIDLNRVSFIVMREMRSPIIALIVVYAISILVMVSIPGPVIEGKTHNMSIFHALYFMTYTATTTGFGEIPYEFNNAQRFWAMACLYVSVITWFYAIGSIVRLFQNPFFVRALEERQFTKAVKRISGPFFIVCGFGDTGSLLARGLSDHGFPAVIIDDNEERIKTLKLRDYRVAMSGFCADASVPKHLLEAGVQHPNCKAVVAITNCEETNLKIAALARLLNPGIGIIAMSKVEVFEETLATLGGEVHVVDPFKTFAKVLGSALKHPEYTGLSQWLAKEPGATLNKFCAPPMGHWIICGYGRMGHEVNRVLTLHGIDTTVIDPHEATGSESPAQYIVGRTTAKTLVKARVDQAVGILAGTDDDGHNLGILLNARNLNPGLFSLVRQNRHENRLAFAAANIDLIMQPTMVTSRRILFLLIAPLLKPFFAYLVADEPDRQQELLAVIQRLNDKIGVRQPHLQTIFINENSSHAALKYLADGNSLRLGHLIRHPDDLTKQLPIVVLIIKSGDTLIPLPSDDYQLKSGDQLLLCGTQSAVRLLNATLNNEYTLAFVQSGQILPRGYVMQWFARRQIFTIQN
ncbi:TrkA family potassium uptake protein [Methylicorpusculum sp.]|uniref:potassium channel family protein n=1 Tax=Methylicorpusculum sp. TaxID=2713644 RepID=UPI002727EF1B|nr:NAD-binding protein [Methylicorpusculum sp.]MDO8844557.1 NAD-binding protein [Methylicorpusculum sp.]